MQKITEIKVPYILQQKEFINGAEIVIDKHLTRYYEIPYVKGWARFGHYLIDCVFFYIFTLTLYLSLGVILKMTNSIYLIKDLGIIEYDYLYQWFLISPIYYFIFEFSMQATLGKAILKRVLVNEYGEKPSLKQHIIRNLVRLFPLNAFTCFAKVGLHDEVSKTFVIRKKDLAELKLLQQINEIDTTLITPNN